MVPSRSALTALKTFMASMTHRVAPVTTLEPTSTKGGSAGEEDRYTVPARGALTVKASASRSRTTFGADGAFEAGAIAGCVSGVRPDTGRLTSRSVQPSFAISISARSAEAIASISALISGRSIDLTRPVLATDHCRGYRREIRRAKTVWM